MNTQTNKSETGQCSKCNKLVPKNVIKCDDCQFKQTKINLRSRIVREIKREQNNEKPTNEQIYKKMNEEMFENMKIMSVKYNNIVEAYNKLLSEKMDGVDNKEKICEYLLKITKKFSKLYYHKIENDKCYKALKELYKEELEKTNKKNDQTLIDEMIAIKPIIELGSGNHKDSYNISDLSNAVDIIF